MWNSFLFLYILFELFKNVWEAMFVIQNKILTISFLRIHKDCIQYIFLWLKSWSPSCLIRSQQVHQQPPPPPGGDIVWKQERGAAPCVMMRLIISRHNRHQLLSMNKIEHILFIISFKYFNTQVLYLCTIHTDQPRSHLLITSYFKLFQLNPLALALQFTIAIYFFFSCAELLWNSMSFGCFLLCAM